MRCCRWEWKGVCMQSRSVKDIIALVEELHARSDLPIAIRGRWEKDMSGT